MGLCGKDPEYGYSDSVNPENETKKAFSWRNIILVSIYAAGFVALLYFKWDPLVSTAIFAAIVAGWLGSDLLLIIWVHVLKRSFPGKDKWIFDLFTIVHFLFGAVMAAAGLQLVYLAGAAIIWEFFEIKTKNLGETERIINRIGDVLIAIGAWFVVRYATDNDLNDFY